MSFTRFLARLDKHVPLPQRRRLAIALGFGGAIIGTLIAVYVAESLDPSLSIGAWVGLFLANWIGNGGLLVPIPGLRLVAWTMTVHQGSVFDPVLVGLIAGVAMALGQLSFYTAGRARPAHGNDSKEAASSRRSAALRAAQVRTHDYVQRHGFATILTLSLLPNPLTTFASIAAGRTGMPTGRYLVADLLGHLVLGLALALFGRWLAGG